MAVLLKLTRLTPGWVLIRVNFDPIQEIGPKVEGGHSFKGGHSFTTLQYSQFFPLIIAELHVNNDQVHHNTQSVRFVISYVLSLHQAHQSPVRSIMESTM